MDRIFFNGLEKNGDFGCIGFHSKQSWTWCCTRYVKWTYIEGVFLYVAMNKHWFEPCTNGN
jgi:hypothetical protein